MNEEWKIISAYTRQQVIDDGVLIDVTAEAKAMGVKASTCVTNHLFYDFVTPPAGLEGEGQSIEGRLQDLLFAR